MAFYYAPQFIQTTLNVAGGIDASQTTGIVLTSVSGIDIAKPGIVCFTWADPLDTSKSEWVSYTSINGANELVGATRGAEGGTGKAHANGAVAVFPISKSHINNLNDMFTTGGEGFTQIATPSNPASGSNKLYVKSDGKFYQLNSAGLEEPAGYLTDEWIDLTDGATIAVDCSQAGKKLKFRVKSLGGNRALTLTNQASGKAFVVQLGQDGTGSRTVTWFNKAVATVTMTIANPAVVTMGVDIPTGTPIKFSTTGALPTGVTAGTVYWYMRVDATTGNIATSLANAQAGTTITTSGSQSGVHSSTIEIRWAGGSAPTLSTGKYLYDTFGFLPYDANIIEGFIIGQAV